eukprot:TRINITY_DN8845_c0_g1_i4.p1 TRINITY_DN8845_c0_g1~~TRINITY_DN8845_c0_g1_i4.p1  ORF type:complete len:349 (-),score=37.06 TRINITY_DN8845_c0_g1_i4:140-1186(-)
MDSKQQKRVRFARSHPEVRRFQVVPDADPPACDADQGTEDDKTLWRDHYRDQRDALRGLSKAHHALVALGRAATWRASIEGYLREPTVTLTTQVVESDLGRLRVPSILVDTAGPKRCNPKPSAPRRSRSSSTRRKAPAARSASVDAASARPRICEASLRDSRRLDGNPLDASRFPLSNRSESSARGLTLPHIESSVMSKTAPHLDCSSQTISSVVPKFADAAAGQEEVFSIDDELEDSTRDASVQEEVFSIDDELEESTRVAVDWVVHMPLHVGGEKHGHGDVVIGARGLEALVESTSSMLELDDVRPEMPEQQAVIMFTNPTPPSVALDHQRAPRPNFWRRATATSV